MIVISGCNDQPTFERASICPVQAYLTKPIELPTLAAAIAIALRRFEETQQLQEEVQVGRRRLAERAIIEKAKGVLMKRAKIDETAAYGPNPYYGTKLESYHGRNCRKPVVGRRGSNRSDFRTKRFATRGNLELGLAGPRPGYNRAIDRW